MSEEQDLQIELVASDSTQNLSHREADIAVRMVRPQDPDLIARKIGAFEIGFFASPDYIQENGAPLKIEDLSQHIILGEDRTDRIIRGAQDFGLRLSRTDFAFRTDSQATNFEALRAGIGIGICAQRLAHIHNLTPLFPDIILPPLPVWLVAHVELYHSARIRCVFDFIADHLPQTFYRTVRKNCPP